MMDGQLIDRRLKRDRDRWAGADDTLENYSAYVKNRKEGLFDVGYMDLLFVSNYKGGNSVIAGSSEEVYKCLHPHRERLHLIERTFADKTLQSLNTGEGGELEMLASLMAEAFEDCKADESSVKGFGTAKCSALYHLHFPKLIPVIDRRVLINRRSPNLKFDGNQVKDLHTHYKQLLETIHKDLQGENPYKSLRDWDKKFFTLPIPKDYKSTKP